MLKRVTNSQPTVVIACHAWAGEQIGGSFKVASEFAVALARRGHRVCYVCGTSSRLPVNPTLEQGIELWRYPYPAAASPDPRNLWGHVRGAFRLTREIGRTGPIVCVNGHTPLQFLGAAWAVGRGCRRVCTVHSPFEEELKAQWLHRPGSLKKSAALRLARIVEGANLRRATHVHGASQFTLNLLRSTYPRLMATKGIVSPAWVDTARFQPVADKNVVRRGLGGSWMAGSSDDVACPMFFTVRRLEARMGLENLIDAARRLMEQGQRFRLFIGGSGSLKADLEQRITRHSLQEHVKLLGRISEEDLPRCFAAADCFVLPSSGLECFGLTILEAYACGIPVIATPVAAIPELVSLAGPAWLTADVSADSLAARMSEFLTGRLRREPGRLREIAEQFDVERGTSRLEAVCLGTAPASEMIGKR